MAAVIDRNPFPAQATVSMASLSALTQEGRRAAPSLDLPHIRQLRSRAESYVAGHRSATTGVAVLVRGAHGSGKTHAMYQAADALRRRSDGAAQAPIVLAVQVNDADPAATLRELLGLFTLETLRELRQGQRATVVADQLRELAQTEQDPGAKPEKAAFDRELEKLHAEPALVERLQDAYAVARDVVEDLLGQEVALVSARQAEFRSAFRLLKHAECGPIAHRWLIGRELTKEEAARIGVCGPLSSAAELQASFFLLVGLCGRAARPALVFVDQFEKLVFDREGELVHDLSFLRLLADRVSQARGLLAIAGTEPAWSALPSDLQERFDPANTVVVPALSVEEVSDLIDIYVAAAMSDGAAGARPFTDDAIREVARYGVGNARRMLQICCSIFDQLLKHADGPLAVDKLRIDGKLIERVVEETQTKFDENSVVLAIESAIVRCGLSFERDRNVAGAVMHFAIPAGAPRLLIKVQTALFHDGEAREALGAVNLIERMRKAKLSAAVALVVVGYASRQVSQLLSRSVHEYLIYDPHTFDAQFKALLTRYTSKSRTQSPDAVVDANASAHADKAELGQALRDLQSELTDLLERREAETTALERRLVGLYDKRNAEAPGAQLGVAAKMSAVTRWPQEKAALEARIAKAREERQRSELEDITSEATDVEKRRRIYGFGACGLLAMIAGGFAYVSLIESARHLFEVMDIRGPIDVAEVLLKATALSLVVFAICAVSFYYFLQLRRDARLRGRIATFEQLKRTALSTRLRTFPTPPYRDPNPQVRYAALLQGRYPKDSLSSRLAFESAGLVRREVIRAMAREQDGKIAGFLDTLKVGEWAYVIDAFARTKSAEQLLPDAPAELAALAAIYGVRLDERKIGSADLALHLVLRSQSSAAATAILRLYENGLDEEAIDFLPKIPLRALQRAAETFSPFEEGGLGTYDHLRRRREIDEYYLFFCQLLALRTGSSSGAAEAESSKPAGAGPLHRPVSA